jgi:hypothetical protein
MSKGKDNDMHATSTYLAWLFVSLVTVVMVSLILPFPISFIVSLIVIISLSIVRADIALKKAGMGGVKSWYKSFSSLQSGRGWNTNMNSSLYSPLTFSCMNCGNVHNKTACPKCGSKAVKAG